MLIFGRKLISERLQKEALLYPFCQDFAVPNVIIHSNRCQREAYDVVNVTVKCCTTCQPLTRSSVCRIHFRLYRSRVGASIAHYEQHGLHRPKPEDHDIDVSSIECD